VIIQCKECGTKYRFDKSQISGEGIWVRCSHCKAVFFHENPLAGIAPLTDSIEPEENTNEKIYEENAEDIDRIFSEGETEDDTQKLEQEKAYDDAGEVMDNEEVSEEETQKPRSSGRKIAIFLILVILIAGGIYLWTSPRAIKMISNKVLPRVEQIFGIKSSDTPDVGLHELGVDLINVKERFVKNWVAGDIMVVEGSAVNNNKCSVSNIKIRGKILDSSGNVLSEVESNCGNILTDDELKGLTEKEMMKELSNPYGREVSNAGIEPGTDIPFMLALIMPAGDASEFLVELAGIEIADNK